MTNSAAAADQGGAPPLPHHRRPRVREVSSRFMSPSPNPSSSIDHLKSPQTRPKHSPAPDHHRPARQHDPFSENIPQTLRRSLDHCPKPESFSTHRKQQHRSLKENEIQISKSTPLRTGFKPSRSDTPIATADRIVPSRFRLPHGQKSTVTDAAKLLQSSVGLSFSSITENSIEESESSSSISIQGGSCPNTPLSSSKNTTTWPQSDTGTDDVKLVEVEDTSLSTRFLPPCSTSIPDRQISSKFSTPSLCSRSLNFQPSVKNTPHNPSPTINSLTAEQQHSTKSVIGVGSKKGGKKQVHSSDDDVHSLKLLYNHYLLWRFANAKADASIRAQTTQMENHFCSVGADISKLRDSVKKKRAELAILRKIKALSTILESQMPYLDEWSAFEEEYTCSLSGTTTALTNSLLSLPVTGNVQVNIKEAAEALDSAVKATDTIVDQMESFVPKAEEMGTLMSELANVVDIQRSLVDECGNLLLNTHNLQIEDCSLRGHLMQLHRSNVLKNNNKDAFVDHKS
ncbi:protein ENDOSPERM DEFECTIVE 1 [Rutidosis leptorrhynchoides]|uniref:protein ENDOSPERM DEFECTIVE 1 n=1 Tax=Rutidosis leptorrhynchoides TaxID=125765 RepID=UPI003A9921B1